MLYRFIVENFRSFRAKNEISFIPKEASDCHATYTDTKMPVLRDAVIYGANASGKSNFVKAIALVQKMVLDNSLIGQLKNMAFRLDRDTIGAPSIFVTEIRLQDRLYQYALAISFKDSEIIAESLKTCNETENQWNPVFLRILDEGVETIEFYNTNEANRGRYEIYREDMRAKRNRLVLSEIASKQLSGDDFVDSINNVYDWFDKLMVLFPESEYNLLGAIAQNREAVNELYKKYFKIFHIDIEEIGTKEIPESYTGVDSRIRQEIKFKLSKSSDRSFAMVHGTKRDMLAQLDDNGNLQFLDVIFRHKKNDFMQEFDSSDESDGTKRLFDLIPMLGYIIDADRVAIIDEIDRSLHCLLTREMFRYYFEQSKNRKSQLICTTHDVLLMDGKLLGRREIWFVDKKDKESTIYPLDKYNLGDAAINIGLNYLIGRFEGRPNF